jgi:hypothetical protein
MAAAYPGLTGANDGGVQIADLPSRSVRFRAVEVLLDLLDPLRVRLRVAPGAGIVRGVDLVIARCGLGGA